jgi:hypothetical protein
LKKKITNFLISKSWKNEKPLPVIPLAKKIGAKVCQIATQIQVSFNILFFKIIRHI